MLRFLAGVGVLIVVIGSLYVWHQMGQRELVCLAKNVYFEARGEPDLGQNLVASVTLTRADANDLEFGGSSICEVVYHATYTETGKKVAQFSWTLLKPADQTPRDQKKWDHAIEIARQVQNGTFVPEPKFKGVMWYMNPETADRHNICWFRRHLVSVGIPEGGHHEFFRRPVNDIERLGLKGLDVPECKPLPKKKTAKK